jgi:hypothetical protein
MTFLELLKKSISLIKREPLIMVPYVAFYFISQILETQFTADLTEMSSITFSMIQLFLLRWGLELMVSILTVAFAAYTLKRTLDIQKAVTGALHRFPSLILSSVLIVVPLALVVLSAGMSFESMTMLQGLLLIIFLLPISIIIQFLPISIYLSSESGIKVLKDTILLLKNNFKKVVLFSLMVFSLTLFTLILGEIFIQVPVLGKAILGGVIFGCFSSCITVLTLCFFRSLTQSK